jgi:hypothetical protein
LPEAGTGIQFNDSMPQCQKCGKESNNLRICPFCHNEYVQAERPSKATPRVSFGVAASALPPGTARSSAAIPAHRPGLRGYIDDLSPVVKWGVPALIVVFGVWYAFFSGERRIPVGVVMPNMVVAPMVPAQAEAFLRRMKATAKVEVRGTEVYVTFPAENFPVHRDGQLGLAQQFARADELVEGHKRVITFSDGAGNVFAKASASGVVMVR